MIDRHWNYFLALESDFARCSRFVEFEEDNHETYSTEFTKLLIAASSEFDVIAKELCSLIDSSAKRENIKDYQKVICGDIPEISTCEVKLPKYGLNSTPWSTWGSPEEEGRPKTPPWWHAHNDVKHDRAKNYKKGNFENCFSAMSGLFVGYLYLQFKKTACREIPITKAPVLFSVVKEEVPFGRPRLKRYITI